MSFELVGYYQSVDQAAAEDLINVMQDPTIFTFGKNARIPQTLSFLQGAAMLTAATTLTSAAVKTPSLRTRNDYYFEPLVNDDDFGSIPPISWLDKNPIPLTPGENMNFASQTDNTGAVAIQGFVWLSDGPPVQRMGDIFSVQFTTAITLAAGTWVNGAITLRQQIPNGMYEVVGLRARGANLQAARIVFPGYPWRPGVPAVNAVSDIDLPQFRNGELGVWGTFDSDNLPSIDALGHTDTAQSYVMDIIKIG